MRSSRVRVILFAALFALACGSLAGSAYSQDQQIRPRQEGPKPMFVTLPARHLENMQPPPTSTVTNWSGSFKSGTQTFHFKMVGTSPLNTNTSTSVTAYIIPIKIVCNGVTEDPQTIQGNGQTAVQVTTSSPIYNAGVDFKQGGTDVGNTQYIDAFQRGNFWKGVTTHTSYHVLLATPVVLAEQTLSVPSNQCSIGNPFGFGNIPIVSINYFDAQLQSIISGMSVITPNSFPVAMTYNTYLSNNSGLSGCCIGGYHSAFGSVSALQTYAHFTYIPFSGQFSQDVSALSHETGEWVDDPFISNAAPNTGNCGGIVEVGDPLEVLANFGDFPYTLNGFTYHLQDLCFLDYYSGNTTQPVNHWYTFQNEKHSKCS
jgi:hypothetical protein